MSVSSNLKKPMKDHIDLNIYMEKKKKNSSRSGFWGAAKKWQIWKQKAAHNTRDFTTILPVEKPVFRQYRETDQSSCRHVQPRFSLDLGRRISSFDGPIVDAPRASWDGGRIFDENAPGGSDQTRNYYLDSSSSSKTKRRKSLDRRSTSLRNTAAESMLLPNTNDPNTNSLRVGCKDTVHGKESKKSTKWNWKLFPRGRNNKDGDEEDAAYTRRLIK